MRSYKIQSQSNGLVLSQSTNDDGLATLPGSPVVQANNTDGLEQSVYLKGVSSPSQYGRQMQRAWQIVVFGGTGAGALVVDVPAGSKSEGAKLQLWNNNDGTNQLWRLRTTSSGPGYNIININSEMALDIPSSSTTPGTQLQQSLINSNASERWLVTETVLNNGAEPRIFLTDFSGGPPENATCLLEAQNLEPDSLYTPYIAGPGSWATTEFYASTPCRSDRNGVIRQVIFNPLGNSEPRYTSSVTIVLEDTLGFVNGYSTTG